MKTYKVQAYPGVPRNFCKVVVFHQSAENLICSSVSVSYRQYLVTSGFIFDIGFVTKVQECKFEIELLGQIRWCHVAWT